MDDDARSRRASAGGGGGGGDGEQVGRCTLLSHVNTSTTKKPEF